VKTFLAGLAAFLVPTLCLAEAQFSIVRDTQRGGTHGTQTIALVCGKDLPELSDCKVFRAANGTAQKTKPIAPAVAQKILAEGNEKLVSYAARADAPEGRMHWTLVYSGKTSQGGMDLSDKKARHLLATSLMSLENQLSAELDR
jgi:hypothetical protein